MAGLEVFDLASNSWINIERTSLSPANEWVIFGGRCLEKISNSKVKACLHRVTVPNFIELESPPERIADALDVSIPTSCRRFCFVYEQKLSDYF